MGNTSVDNRRELFESLYEQYRPPVLGYCRRRTSLTGAEDACSETFLIAWRRLDELPGPPHTLPYLYRIAANVLANHARAFRRRSRLDAKLKGLGVAPAADPSALVVMNARHHEVIDALQRLKPKDREIVMLYTWEDLSRETIAEMMGLTKAAIDQRIHRSYRRLARILRPVASDSLDTARITYRSQP